MTKWRTGRSLGRTVYLQLGDEPSKADELVGMMETRALADRVVALHNREVDGGGEVSPMLPLEEDVRAALNRNSAENSSNTPDYLLAEFLVACLDAYNVTVRQRDAWYGIHPEPGGGMPLPDDSPVAP